MEQRSFERYVARMEEYTRRIHFYAAEVEGLLSILKRDMQWVPAVVAEVRESEAKK